MDSHSRIDPHAEALRSEDAERLRRAMVHLELRTLAVVMIAALLVGAAFATGDILLNLKYLGQRFANEYGVVEDMAQVWGISSVTLGAFIVIGLLLSAGKWRIALIAYLAFLLGYGLLLLPVIDQIIRDSVMSYVPGAFGETGTVEMPSWLYWALAALLIVIFTAPGICVCIAELVLSECWHRWQLRKEVLAKRELRADARAAIARRDGLKQLRKTDTGPTVVDWTRQVLIEHQRELEASCTDDERIKLDSCESTEKRQNAHARQMQTRKVIDSLNPPRGEAPWTAANSALH